MSCAHRLYSVQFQILSVITDLDRGYIATPILIDFKLAVQAVAIRLDRR